MKLTLALLSSLLISIGMANAAGENKTADVPSSYPLKTCVVSGEKFGEMGKPVKVTGAGTDVYLCCKSCIKDFNKDPAKYVAMVTAAAKK